MNTRCFGLFGKLNAHVVVFMPSFSIILDQSHKADVKNEGNCTDSDSEEKGRSISHDWTSGAAGNLLLNGGRKPQPETVPIKIKCPDHRARNALLVSSDGVAGNDLARRVHKIGTKGEKNH